MMHAWQPDAHMQILAIDFKCVHLFMIFFKTSSFEKFFPVSQMESVCGSICDRWREGEEKIQEGEGG